MTATTTKETKEGITMKMTSEEAETLRNATLKQLSFALLARDLWNYYGPTPVGVAKIGSLINYADEVGEDFVTHVTTMAIEGKLRDWCSEHRLVHERNHYTFEYQQLTINAAIDDAFEAIPNGDDRQWTDWVMANRLNSFSPEIREALLKEGLELRVRELSREYAASVYEEPTMDSECCG
jgi:hypothetical protein